MKYYCSILLIAVLASVSYADTYTWSDENGTHFTDDLQNVPATYQKKAMQDVRVDAKKPEPAVPSPPEQITPETSNPPVKQKKVAKKAKQYHRGKLLAASETTDAAKMREGCYLHFSIQPGGVNVPWNPNSYQSGVMKMDVQTQSDCLQDCMDNAQQKSLDAAKRWILYGRCNYFGEKIWSNEKTQ